MHKDNKIGFGIGLVLAMILLALLISKLAYGQEIMTSPIYPVRQGEALILRLSERQCAQTLNIFGRAYTCDPDGRLVIGADLQERIGTHRLGDTNIYVDVAPGKFPDPVYRIRGRPPRISEKKRLEREARRKEELRLQLIAFTAGPERYPELVASEMFGMPLKSIHITDEFGLERRYYRRRDRRDAVSSWHRGVDLRARPVGRPVRAVASGCVVQAHHYTAGAEGKMLTLYHGSGIYSLYLHLDGFEVKEGDCVKRGQLVARSGKTGTRHPHLHLAMKVNLKTVSPFVFIEQFNGSLKES